MSKFQIKPSRGPAPFYLSLIGSLIAIGLSASNLEGAPISRFDFSEINRMIIFGDSLSDYGNTGTVHSAYQDWSFEANHEFPRVPGWPSPYDNIHRFTNGNMWSVYLSQNVNAVNSNFAVVDSMDQARALPYNPFFGEATNSDAWYNEIRDAAGIDTGIFENTPSDHGVAHQNWAWGGAPTTMQYNENALTPSDFPNSSFINAELTDPIHHGYSLVSVEDQISMFGQVESGQSFDDSTMVFLWAGANDYILYGAPVDAASFVANKIYPPQRPMDLGQKAAQDQLNNLQSLIDQGATNITVMNLPDIGQTPAAFAGEFSELSLQPTQYVNDFNAALLQGIMDLTVPEGVSIGFVDIFTKFNDMINNPAAYGLNPDYMQQSIVLNENDPSDVTLNPTFTNNGYNTDGWLFWDHVHPTENGHEILGNYVFESIAVPEPKTLILFGLFFVGWILFRKRSRVGQRSSSL